MVTLRWGVNAFANCSIDGRIRASTTPCCQTIGIVMAPCCYIRARSRGDDDNSSGLGCRQSRCEKRFEMYDYNFYTSFLCFVCVCPSTFCTSHVSMVLRHHEGHLCREKKRHVCDLITQHLDCGGVAPGQSTHLPTAQLR